MRRVVLALPLLSLSMCALPMDAGCISYGEARLTLPRPLADDATGRWIADLDTRMTGTCR